LRVLSATTTARCDADASLQGRVCFETAYRSDQLQRRAHGPLCVVLVGLWVPEVDEHPVTHVLRDKAAEALHGLCVVVGDLIGSGASQEQAIVGETPNLAARLQGVAEPNSACFGAPLHRVSRSSEGAIVASL
jgi:hypothetical protein